MIPEGWDSCPNHAVSGQALTKCANRTYSERAWVEVPGCGAQRRTVLGAAGIEGVRSAIRVVVFARSFATHGSIPSQPLGMRLAPASQRGNQHEFVVPEAPRQEVFLHRSDRVQPGLRDRTPGA